MSLSDVTEDSVTKLVKTSTPGTNLPAQAKSWRETWKTVVVLFKLRIVFLLVVAATAGAFLASGGWPGLKILGLTWLTGGMAAAGASALNQYLERQSDASMRRTKQRPLVTGKISKPRWVPVVGLLLILIPVIAVFFFNPPLSFFLLLGAFIYVVIYTLWLKPRTLLNVVIGGLAGSAAVLSGSAAAGAWNSPGALILALILFLWSPFHFWSLALIYREDYARADFPMLPTRVGPRQAAWWVFAHTLPTGIAGLLMIFLPYLGWVYFIPVLLVTLDLFWRSLKLIYNPSPRNARGLFISSNFYLLILLIAICVGSVIPF